MNIAKSYDRLPAEEELNIVLATTDGAPEQSEDDELATWLLFEVWQWVTIEVKETIWSIYNATTSTSTVPTDRFK
eukprot:SAG31_NODE_5626_length_2416_cov_1.366422_3_plen_75_part_00